MTATPPHEDAPATPGPHPGTRKATHRPSGTGATPERPTATAPDSVEESVYTESEHAGKDGPDAADPPTAAKKARGSRGEEPPE